MNKLDIALKSNPSIDVADFVTSTQVVLAKKGKGKSYLAGVQAESLLEHGHQVVIIDPVGAWWGIRSSADGKTAGYSVVVFGGEHADVPLEPNAGELIADAIASEHFSAVIDLSLFRKGEALRFMMAFLETLYRKNRQALHLFIDEADVVAPQKSFSPEQARTLGAAEDIVRRGRQRGIGCTLITQRPQVLNKDVLTQADMLTTLGMNHPKDLAAIAAWIAVHGDVELAKTMNASLPSLPVGEAWMWAPASNLFERIRVRRKRTFDSGRTPKAGERAIAPKVLAPVDLQRLGAAIAETAARARDNDPKALRARVAELEKQLAGGRAAPAPRIVEKRVLEPALVKRLEDAFSAIDRHWGRVDEKLVNLVTALEGARKMLHAASAQANAKPPAAAAPARASSRPTSTIELPSGAALGKCESAILEALAGNDKWLSRTQVATLAGYSPSSSSFANACGALRAANLVQYSSEGIALTDSGRSLIGPRTNPTGAALRELWKSKLPRREADMLEQLAHANGYGLTREELAEQLGMSITSSSFANYIGHLHSTGLVVKQRDREHIVPELVS